MLYIVGHSASIQVRDACSISRIYMFVIAELRIISCGDIRASEKSGRTFIVEPLFTLIPRTTMSLANEPSHSLFRCLCQPYLQPMEEERSATGYMFHRTVIDFKKACCCSGHNYAASASSGPLKKQSALVTCFLCFFAVSIVSNM